MKKVRNRYRKGVNHNNLVKVKLDHVFHNSATNFVKATFWNARSLNNKTIALHDYLASGSCDILAVAESWLSEDGSKSRNNMTFATLLPQGFKIIHSPRQSETEGGGVAFIYNENVNFCFQRLKLPRVYKQFESLTVLAQSRTSSTCISVVYRPQPTRKNKLKLRSFWPEFSDFLSYHIQRKCQMIIGDLNFHLDVLDDSNTVKLQNLLSEFGLTQHIKEPTHILGHTLDVLISRNHCSTVTEIAVKDLCLITDQGNSIQDHFAITWNLVGNRITQNPDYHTYRPWNNINSEVFAKAVSVTVQVQDRQFHTNDLDSMVKIYNSTLLNLADIHAPLKTIKTHRQSNPWYSSDISKLKKERRQLERTYMRTKAPADHQKYKKCCILFYKAVRSSKILYCRKLLEEAGRDRKKLSSATNKILGCSEKQSYPKAESQQQLTNEFMRFFTDKVHQIRVELQGDASNPSEFSQPCNPPPLGCFSPTDHDEIVKIITGMSNKQCQLDPIPTHVLKKHCTILSPVITKIVNSSLHTGQVPVSLKTALVRPILKDAALDPTMLQNYRPVSSLPVLSKILEKVVSARLNSHISAHKLLDSNQSAYRKFHSTETALLKVHNDILHNLDQDRIVAMVTIDVSAAFDTVDHQSLLNRFYHHFGLRDTALKWMESYLKDRIQSVIIDGIQSDPVKLEHGFPQGATLAGILYDMFSAPVENVVEMHPAVDHHAYADDNNCYIAFSIADQTDAIHKLNLCANDLVRWMNNNLLKVNGSKTEAIFFFPKKNTPIIDAEININSKVVDPSNVTKSLGVKMDSLLTMEKHINFVTSSAYYHIRRISKVRQFLDLNSTKSLIQNLVISRLDYCNSLLVNLPKRLIQKLQRVQNHSARVIFRKSRRTRTTPLLKELHWLPLIYRIKFKILLITFKCLNGLAPCYLSSLISVYNPCRTLRSNDRLLGTLVAKSYKKRKHGGRSFRVAAPELWNAIPLSIRCADTVARFKVLLKTYFFNQHYNP